jgi:hypothetical protein
MFVSWWLLAPLILFAWLGAGVVCALVFNVLRR